MYEVVTNNSLEIILEKWPNIAAQYFDEAAKSIEKIYLKFKKFFFKFFIKERV